MSAINETNPFSHILCWVDGSEEGCAAAERAAGRARALDAKLSFLAIGDSFSGDPGFLEYARIEGVSAPAPIIPAGDISACLDQAVSISTRVGVQRPERIFRTGNISTVICEAARTQKADLVVIGHTRPSLIERILHLSIGNRAGDGCDFAVLTTSKRSISEAKR